MLVTLDSTNMCECDMRYGVSLERSIDVGIIHTGCQDNGCDICGKEFDVGHVHS